MARSLGAALAVLLAVAIVGCAPSRAADEKTVQSEIDKMNNPGGMQTAPTGK